MAEINQITAAAALMIKDARIAELEAELRDQRGLFVEHAGRLNNRIKLQLEELRYLRDALVRTEFARRPPSS